jgi:hypothetical protein
MTRHAAAPHRGGDLGDTPLATTGVHSHAVAHFLSLARRERQEQPAHQGVGRTRLGSAAVDHARERFDPVRSAQAVYDELLGLESEPAPAHPRERRSVGISA